MTQGNIIRCQKDWTAHEVLLEQEGSVIPDQARRLYHSQEQFRELLNHAAHPNTPRPHSCNVPV